jgi:hypothetical protein
MPTVRRRAKAGAVAAGDRPVQDRDDSRGVGGAIGLGATRLTLRFAGWSHTERVSFPLQPNNRYQCPSRDGPADATSVAVAYTGAATEVTPFDD